MKIIKWFDEHFEEYILVFLSAFTVVVIFLQVVMRYVFGSSLTWSEEIARYAFIWMIYLGVSYGVKKKKHLGVDALNMLFKEKGQIIISMIANVSFLIFAIVITYYGFDIVLRVTRASAAMQIPMEWVYAAPVVGLALTAIRLSQNLIKEYQQLKKINNNQENDYIIEERGDVV
ncbi:TRAP transporter small permease [Bacilli bacterium]|uniref:TRAP transporter small permease n=1 Tax=Oceanobacillus sp. FSL K6-0118 TaxID=2921418 RepID=UPI0006221B56|nr:C4-dicarboxylate ABC transporter [Bacilli bacterium VT-13-104]PZD87997.1 TRAP transporter small permease [Bacilli bacterium]PZD90188.1 TRAP transporter small permease [Bacilli bacterium]PZD92082.1 TRAP transporter small permease [Bacilli bacterium]RCO06966.1 TRAP transporter small permease [Bacilli bacterium]